MKMRPVIADNLMWYPIPIDDVIANELSYVGGFESGVRGCFDPLGKIINSHKKKLMLVLPFQIYTPIKSIPQVENDQGKVIMYNSLGGMRKWSV